MQKFLMFCRKFNLRNIFRNIGIAIGTYPIVFLVISLFCAVLSFGMINFCLKNRLRDGYTPSTSQSRYEMNVYKEFFNLTGNFL